MKAASFTVKGRQELGCCRGGGCGHAGECSCHLQANACVGVDLQFCSLHSFNFLVHG